MIDTVFKELNMTRRDANSSEMWVKNEIIEHMSEDISVMDGSLKGTLNKFIVISLLIKDKKKTFLCSSLK